MSTYQKIQNRVYEIIEKGKAGDKASRVFDICIVTLIILNVTAIILGSIEEINVHLELPFRIFEIVSVIFFTIEYLGTHNEVPEPVHLGSGVIKG